MAVRQPGSPKPSPLKSRAARRRMGKKAVFITLSSILIVSLFLLYFSTKDDLTVKQKAEVQESRVASINNFAENLENVYLERALYATSQRALYSITEHMIDEGEYVNLSRDFPDALINGSLRRDGGDVDLDPMDKNTFMYWLDNLTEVSRQEMNIYTDFNVTGVIINQSYPWEVNVTLFLKYNITSPQVVSIVREDAVVSTDFSVEGFTDPLIAVETGGDIMRELQRSKIYMDTGNTDAEISVDPEVILDNETYIFQNRTVRSFLMTFTRNLND